MPFIEMPDSVQVPDMLARDRDVRTWTLQPGYTFRFHTTVAAGPQVTLPLAEQTNAAHLVNVPLARSGGGTTVTLRPYQGEAIDAVTDAWRQGAKAPLIVLPTASGKTIISAEIMARMYVGAGAKSLFIAHREELLTQTMDKVRLVSPVTRVGLVQQKTDEMGREITVASIATIGHSSGKRLKALIENGPYGLVVIDEAHHAVGAQYMKVIAALRAANPDMLLMGMTATPGRADGIALDRVFDVVAYERNTFEMIRDGWLVPPRGFHVDIDIDLDKVETGDGDYVVTQLSKIMNTPHVNRAVVEAWRSYGHDRKCIVFAVDVAHAHALAQEFNDAGHPAAAVDGKMKKKDRNDVLNRFREGAIKLLVNCQVLTEGYDDPSAEGVVFARPTQSQGLYIQSLGRGLRLYPGKTECLVIDCVGNSKKHRPVQLASLVGFDPERKFRGLGKGDGEEEDITEEAMTAEVKAAKVGEATEVSFGGRRPKSNYQWRETTLGWILQIPRIGYYLVAWSDKARHMSTIRFFDQREGKRNTPPREIVKNPIEFDMAYGLVESEMDRIFRARAMRRDDGKVPDPKENEQPVVSFVALDEGVDEDIVLPDEELMLKDAAWRERTITPKQRDLLIELGVKEKTMPGTVGEASDLITIIRVERDMKMRMPATLKQINYLRFHGLPLGENLTKGMAAKAIWTHRRAAGR
jgi:superfamily II DNA or RNA helicase